MPLVPAPQWKMNSRRCVVNRPVAPLLKAQCASRDTLGRSHTEQSTVVTMSNDWKVYGKAMEAQH